VTLHNRDEIKRKDIRIGDRVVVFRSGDVIPKVGRIILEKRPGNTAPYHLPDQCPVCGTDVMDQEGEVVTRCVNPSCPAQIKESIKHFVSKKATNIEGLGEELVGRLVDTGLIKNIADIYTLKHEDLEAMERMGEKSASNIIEAIDKSRKISFSRFLYALGIRHVGEGNSHILARHFGSLESLMKTNREDLIAVPEIGEKAAYSLSVFFSRKSNQETIRCLLDSMTLNTEGPMLQLDLEGLKFVVTGTLRHFARDEIKDYIQSKGGRVSGSVSSKTDFLVAGESPGSKYDKAIDAGIPVLNEAEFMERFGNP